MNSLSFKTKFCWISACEEKNKIIIVKFGKYKNKSIIKNLVKFKNNLNHFINKRRNKIRFNFHIKGNVIQKKVWKELR